LQSKKIIRPAKNNKSENLTSISFKSKGYWLDHMFLLPEFIGNGLGEKMGCKYQMKYPSTIENRTTPLLTLKLNNCSKGVFVYEAEKNKNHRHHF